MSNESLPICPQCGAALKESAPAGLCPNCLMALNLKTETVFTDDTPAAQPPLPPEQLAPHFPQLEILECLGRGGMGVVYKARQKTLNRLVALKLLAPERVGDAKFAERFTREAQALAALNHPNIVTIHDFGQAGGFYFLLMEFVDGMNLRQLLRARKFTPEEALAIVPPLCDALQFAHDRGVIHRDIKPENLLLDKDGRVKVADFGIAKMLGGNDPLAPSPAPSDGERVAKSGEGLPLTGEQTVGTPGYSAPEQKTDPQRVDSRADIYSLGVVFYEMLTGELPGKPLQPPSRKVQIDVRLDEVVLRALEKKPELRYQQASVLKTEVETIASTAAGAPEPSSPQPGLRDSLGLTTSFLPNLLPGERVVHVKRRLWAMFIKSPPSNRLVFSLPPLWEAGLYVTDQRILLVSHFFGLLAQQFSVWFSGKADVGKTELFKEVSTGKSRCFGEFLDIKSETPRKRWYRSLDLLLRIYTREAGALQRIIASASDAGSSRRQEAQTESAGDRASPDRSASAATTGKKPWASFCLAITFAGALLIGSLCELLFRHVSGGWLIGIFISVACASAYLAFVLEILATTATQRVCFKAGAWLAFIAALPVFGLGVFFLNALLSEHGGWHPNPAEEVIVPLVWLGALLLPGCGWRLLRAAGPRLSGAWKVAVVTVGVVTLAVVIQAFPVSYFQKAQKQRLAEQQWELNAAQNTALALPQLRSENVERRRSAAMDLYSLGPGAKRAVPELLRALEDSDGLVRMFAAGALGHIGTDAGPAAASALSRALEDADQRVRFSAAEALASVDLRTTANLAVLIDRLTNRPSQDNDSWPLQRREAVTALAKMGARALPALPALHAIQYEPEVNSHVNVKAAIEQIEKPARRFDGRLLIPPAQSSASEFVTFHPTPNGTAVLDAARDFALKLKWKLLAETGNDERVTMAALDPRGKLVTFEEEAQPGGRTRFRIKTQPGAQISAPQIGSALTAQLGDKLSAVSIPSGETKSSSFGPEQEVTLTEFNNMDGQEALDLDTSTVFKQPKDMDQWSEEGLVQWVKTNGVDLFVDHGPGGVWGLLTTTDAELKLARVGNDKWGAISAGDLVPVLAGNSTPLQIVTQGVMKVYIPPKEAQPPMTFAYKTSSGGVGILQITGYTDKPRGVKIRYRQVQVALPPPAAGQTASFGPIIETVLPFGQPCLNHLLQFRTGKIFKVGHGPATTQAEYEADRKRADDDGGVDLSTSRLEEGLQFIGKGSIFTHEHSPNWNTTTAETVLDRLKHASWTRGVLEPKTKDFPVTYLFRTARGECGIVQLLDVVEDERGYHGPLGKGYGLKLRYKLVESTLAAASDGKAGVNPRRKFVRLVVDKAAMTFEGKPTTWDGVHALLEKVTDRTNTVLECAVTSDQITVQQQNEWFGKCIAMAHSLGFEYASFIGIHSLGSKGTPASIGDATGATRLPAFGPVIERVVGGEGDANQRFIDFDTGKLFAAAEFFGAKAEPSPEETQQWWRKTGIDAVGDTSAAVRGLVGFEMVATPVPAEEWERATPARLDYYFTMAKPGTPATMSGRGELPATFAFKTREGGQGLLQITGFTENPRGVKIRYKLVQTDVGKMTTQQ